YTPIDLADLAQPLREVPLWSRSGATENGRRSKAGSAYLLIAASILAARKLAQNDGGARVPATISAIGDAIRWAEQIMSEIDRRWPVTSSQSQSREPERT